MLSLHVLEELAVLMDVSGAGKGGGSAKCEGSGNESDGFDLKHGSVLS